MALVNCPQCGKPVSDKAVKCPHCGEKQGRAKLIQEQNFKVNTRIVKAIISVLVAIFGILSLLPLFVRVPGWVSFYYLQYFTPLFQMPKMLAVYLAMGVAIIGGLLTLGLFVYGVMQLKKDKSTTWKFWVISLIVALLSAYGTLYFTNRAEIVFYSLQSEKVDAARGTYEWVSKEDGTTTSFSMCYGGFVEYHGKLGEVTHFGYDYEHDKLGVGIYVDGEESFGWYDADMKYLETASGKVSVKKVSDSTFSLEEWLAKKQEAEKQAALEEAKNFCTKDLSAFMLHGKVKTVTYHSGRSFSRCTFNELGSLIKYEIGDNHSSYQYQITHDGNKLLLGDELGTWGEVYEVNDENRLVKYECGGDGVGSRNLYYYHDSNNCPRVEKVFSYDMYDNSWQEGETRKLTYSDIDEYGNWLTKTDHNDEILERRIIEYYSMDK